MRRKMEDFEIHAEHKNGEISVRMKGNPGELLTGWDMIGRDLYENISDQVGEKVARDIIEHSVKAIFMTKQELDDEIVKMTFENIFKEDE